MSQQQNNSEGYVKKATAVQFVLLSLVVGFLGGVIFSVYKLDYSGGEHQHQHGPQAGAGQGAQNLVALEKKVEANPEDASAWRALGNAYFDQQQHAKAIEAYNKFLELSPGNPDVLTDLGVMYRRSGQPEKAVVKFEEAIAIDPGHTQAMFNKGVVLYADLEQKEKAIQVWQKIVSIDPDAKAPNGMPVSQVIEQVRNQ